MTDATLARPLRPPAVTLRDALPWAALCGPPLMLAIHVVGAEAGATALATAVV